MQQDAIQKISAGIQGCEEKRVPAEPIANYLIKRCGEEEEFSALVMQDHKTLPKCFDFVYKQAEKHLNRQNGWIDDNEVYLMAVDYFRLDDEELERKAAEEEAKRQEERRKQEEETQCKANEAKVEKAKEIKKKSADAKIPEGQMSLF